MSPSTYRPTTLIEGYNSLIWTQRYQEYGDFELKTYYVEKTMNDLPLGSFVTLSDSEDFMMVETYGTEEDSEGRVLLTVSGRSFTSFMENRIALDNYEFYNAVEDSPTEPGKTIENGTHAWFINSGSTYWNDADAAAHIISKHMIEGMFMNTPSNLSINAERIPNLSIQQQDTSGRVQNYARYIKRDNLYEGVIELLKNGGQGIRTVRPTSSETNIQYVIYKGVNRTVDQTTNGRVLLEQAQGHLTDVKTVQSIQNHKNTFRVFGTKRRFYSNEPWVTSDTPPYEDVITDPTRTGLNLRHQLIDATEITSLYFAQADPALNSRLELEKVLGRPVNTLSGKVSPNIPYTFGVSYALGDLVSLLGVTGIRQNMRVTEYIRTQDERGETNYPGLSVL